MPNPERRFLILAPWQCVPSTSGAKLRTYHLAKALNSLGPVTFVGFQEAGVAAQPVDFCEETVTIPHPGGYSAGDLVGGLLTSVPMPVRKYTRAAMASALRERLARKSYSAVQLEVPQLASYTPLIRELAPQARIFLDWHNIESEIMARYAEKETSTARRLVARITAPRFEAVERRMVETLDGHIACSERDAEQLRAWGRHARVRVIDNGVDVDAFSDGETSGRSGIRRVLLVGAMDYHANVEGAQWFVRLIWPEVRSKMPSLRLTLVGRNPAPAVRDLASIEGVEVTGTVPDVKPYYRDAAVSIAPLMVGGGSRLKILESMAARVPVVSTTLGAEGLVVRAGEHLEIADAPSAFADAVVRLCSDEARRQHLIRAGRALVEQEYDWPRLGSRLVDFYQEVLGANSSPRHLQGSSLR